MQFARYAIYYTAPKGALADFGAAWLGWDIARAIPCDHPAMDLPVAEITETPRKYGFHGTLKPPFRLAEGHRLRALQEATEALAAKRRAVTLAGMELAALGRFAALTPTGDTADLTALAASIVRELDMFRAPASEAELARRRQARLTPTQEENLVTWGYPYVMEAFKFHLTLTGKLDKTMLARVNEALAPRIQALALAPFVVDAITLVGEDQNGMFHEIHRYDLIG